MKTFVLIAALCIVLPSAADETKPAVALEVPAGAKKFDRIETRDRYVFTQVDVMEKLPDGIYIRFAGIATPRTKKEKGQVEDDGTFLQAGGTTLLPYEALPDAVQKKLGGFVAADARKAREQREADRASGKPARFTDLADADDEFCPYDPKEDAKRFK